MIMIFRPAKKLKTMYLLTFCFHVLIVKINNAELLAMADKTNRHLRLREILKENSSTANLIVM